MQPQLKKALVALAGGALALGGVLAYVTTTAITSTTLSQRIDAHLSTFKDQSGGVILSGTKLPTDRLGTTGDFYFRTSTDQLFGPKTIRVAHPWGAVGLRLVALRGPAGPSGPQGPKGTPGTSILSGTTPPTTQGTMGDFYLDTSTDVLYGPKASGRWPATGTSLIGPPSLIWRGTYSAAATYTKGDAVTHTGSSYVSLTTRNFDRPTTTTVNWALLAAKGTKGTKGTTGPSSTQTMAIKRTTFTVPAATTSSGVAACATGYVVTGGGYTSNRATVHPTQNDGPYQSGTTWKWEVSVTNTTTTNSATVTVYAICAKGAEHFT